MSTFKQLWIQTKQILPKSVSFFKYLAIAGSLVLAFSYASNYIESKFKEGEAAAEARHEQIQKDMQQQQLVMAKLIADAVSADTEKTLARLDALESGHKNTTTIIQREIASDPRLRDPDAGLTDSLFDAVNSARMESHKHD